MQTPDDKTVMRISDAKGRLLVIGRQKSRGVDYTFYRYKDMGLHDRGIVKAVFAIVTSEGNLIRTSDDQTIVDIDGFLKFEDPKPKLCG